MRTRSLAATIVVVALAGCVSPAGDARVTTDEAITIASFDFVESELVAAVYAGALREAGFDVTHLRRVGSREVLLPALERGLVEMVPEYSGSALSFLGGRPNADAAATIAALAVEVAPRGLVALEPAAAQSRNGLVVSAETSQRLGLRTISDLGGAADEMSFGGPPECPDRPLCLPGLERAYGLTFGSFLPLDVGGPLTVAAVSGGTVDVGLLFTSDGSLARHDLVLLRDDRGLQPAESIVPLVRRDALERFGPAMGEALDRVSSQLTTDDLRRLNALVAEGLQADAAAARWLDERGTGAPTHG
ncbi:MAG TPA: ABC transporter substrate-binding protein [Actinomycetota bacterium]|nr:ABC transporter substrate-binding protein [Actinomycetota bacterium]